MSAIFALVTLFPSLKKRMSAFFAFVTSFSISKKRMSAIFALVTPGHSEKQSSTTGQSKKQTRNDSPQHLLVHAQRVFIKHFLDLINRKARLAHRIRNLLHARGIAHLDRVVDAVEIGA